MTTVDELVARLGNPDPSVREAAAAALRASEAARGASEEAWRARLAAIERGVSRAAFEGLTGAVSEGEASSRATTSVRFRLDDAWMVRAVFDGDRLRELGAPVRRARHVWVEPPPGFSGRWVTYFANGLVAHDASYAGGALARSNASVDELEDAVREGHLDVVYRCLGAGVPANHALWTALWPTAESAPAFAAATLVALLEAGADPNWHDDDHDGTARLAAKHPDLLRIVLRYGADPNQANANGETALSFAADWGYAASVDVLLKGGADPNHVLPDLHWSVLFFAAASGHLAVVEALLNAGADPTWVNEHGATALSVARDRGQAAVVRLLLERAPELATLGGDASTTRPEASD